jgi:hypothetical protein
MSRQGRSVFRHIFVESAWTAIRKDRGLMEVYERIAKRRGAKRAIVGVARRLAARLRTCIRLNTPYKITKKSDRDNAPQLKNVTNEMDKTSIVPYEAA